MNKSGYNFVDDGHKINKDKLNQGNTVEQSADKLEKIRQPFSADETDRLKIFLSMIRAC